MDQNVLTTSDVTFNTASLTSNLKLKDSADADLASIRATAMAGNQTYVLPATGGTIAVTSDLSTYLQNVVEDTSPQLGGDLDLNSSKITGTGNINITGAATVSGNLVSATLNTGNGYNELYAMNQNVQTTDAVTFVTVDTGQGANE